MDAWNPSWHGIQVAYDPFGDELQDGPRWTITYQFRRTPESPIESRVFPGLLEHEYQALIGEHWEWLGGDPSDL